jgi:hypothetical protein
MVFFTILAGIAGILTYIERERVGTFAAEEFNILYIE